VHSLTRAARRLFEYPRRIVELIVLLDADRHPIRPSPAQAQVALEAHRLQDAL